MVGRTTLPKKKVRMDHAAHDRVRILFGAMLQCVSPLVNAYSRTLTPTQRIGVLGPELATCMTRHFYPNTYTIRLLPGNALIILLDIPAGDSIFKKDESTGIAIYVTAEAEEFIIRGITHVPVAGIRKEILVKETE